MWINLQRDILEDFASYFVPYNNPFAVFGEDGGWSETYKYTRPPPNKTSGKNGPPPVNAKAIRYQGVDYPSYRIAAQKLGISEDKVYRLVKKGHAVKI